MVAAGPRDRARQAVIGGRGRDATNCPPQSEDIATRLAGIRVQAATALEDKIGTAVRAGTIPADTDTRALAQFYAAVLQGMSAQARDGATRTDLRHIADPALLAWPAAPPGGETDTAAPPPA